MIYQWTVRNREHLQKHGVEPEDAEYVADHAEPPFPRVIGDEKHLVWGRTRSGDFVQVVFVYLADDEIDFASLSVVDKLRFEEGEDVGLIIHAMPMSPAQKRQYRRVMRQ